jgi:glutaconyl-CoA/methylmalonyl-CoA decarboxylase subunit gamma
LRGEEPRRCGWQASSASRILPAMKRELVADTGNGNSHAVVVDAGADGVFTVTVDGAAQQLDARRVRPGTWSVIVDRRAYLVDVEPRRGGAVEVTVGAGKAVVKIEDARTRRLAAATSRNRVMATGETIAAPIAGRIVKVHVAVGEVVAAGRSVVVLEAMKMENELIAERGGTVSKIYRQVGDAVDTGEKLVELL